MKRMICILMVLALALAGCQSGTAETTAPQETTAPAEVLYPDAVQISLDEQTVYVEDGAGVYTDHDIVYYEAGHDFTYGEGGSDDEHDPSEAEAHTVVHITQAGTYRITGTNPAIQIAVDLGEEAVNDPTAVVTLILDGVDITCTVAPAIIFYNVYECGSADPETASPTVDTSAAGANIIIADGSVNTVNGSYVARIYEEGTVVLNEEGDEVEEAAKLHKYDGAVYSKMSMNVSGGEIGDGVLTINAENEGLDSELHLTINGGDIRINSGNDGINTNEDGVSVTTINGGSVNINVIGNSWEGDGIDSNGWLVINGGSVTAAACWFSADAGIDSDLGIYLNGGTVVASGHMLDQIAGGEATYAVFQFATTYSGGTTITLKNEAGETVMECAPVNDFSYLVISSDALVPGDYTLWMGDTQLSGVAGGMGGFFGGAEGSLGGPGNVPGEFTGEKPEGDFQIPEQPGGQMQTQGFGQLQPQDSTGVQPQDGEDLEITDETVPGGLAQIPEGMPGQLQLEPPEGDFQIPEQPGGNMEIMGGEMPTMPEGETMPEGMEQMGEMGELGQMPGGMNGGAFGQMGEASTTFTIVAGGNQFMMVGPAE